MKTNAQTFVISAGAVSALLALSAGSALAGARVWDNSFSTCTSVNCSSLIIPGTVTNPGGNNDPFEIQIYAGTNECVRLDVIQSLGGVDLETVVRAPNGSIYRNDDGSGGGVFNNPVVKINGAPNPGWYSVSINHYFGTPSYADFVLAYGRYNVNNINCSGATTPAFAAAPMSGKVDAPAEPPRPGVGTVPK